MPDSLNFYLKVIHHVLFWFLPLFDFQCITYTEVSDFVAEGTPVPIPNTVVKLSYAYNTWREAAREDWSLLT